jgi:hypothetical protein
MDALDYAHHGTGPRQSTLRPDSASALLSTPHTAPLAAVEVEVPSGTAAASDGGGGGTQLEEMTTTGAGAAVILATLATAALIVSASYLWHLYTAGRKRVSERPLPMGAPLAARTYILGVHALPWLGYVV